MYSTKYLNKNIVQGNAYISIGDPYKDRLENMFRQPKKGETLKPFHITVRITLNNVASVVKGMCRLIHQTRKMATFPRSATNQVNTKKAIYTLKLNHWMQEN